MPDRGEWVLPLVQGHIFLQHLLQIIAGGGVSAALMHVGTTNSVLSTSPVDLQVYPVDTLINPQYTPPRPLLSSGYPPPATFVLPLSGYMPCSGYDPAVISDPILRQSA